MSKIILITCKIEPAILPIAKKPEIIGAIINGIINNKFITTGRQNIVGSLILNKPGTMVSGAKTLFCLLARLRHTKYPMQSTNSIVAPPPPHVNKVIDKWLRNDMTTMS